MTAQPDRKGDILARASAAFRAHRGRTAVLLALLPILVMVWFPLLTGDGSGTPTAIPDRVEMRTDPARPAPLAEVAPTTSPETTAAARHAELARRIANATAPFEPRFEPTPANDPFGQMAANVPRLRATESELLRSMNVTSILLGTDLEPVAIIDGHAYRRGEIAAGLLIERIEERQVVFRSGEISIAIPMKRTDVGGKHE